MSRKRKKNSRRHKPKPWGIKRYDGREPTPEEIEAFAVVQARMMDRSAEVALEEIDMAPNVEPGKGQSKYVIAKGEMKASIAAKNWRQAQAAAEAIDTPEYQSLAVQAELMAMFWEGQAEHMRRALDDKGEDPELLERIRGASERWSALAGLHQAAFDSDKRLDLAVGLGFTDEHEWRYADPDYAEAAQKAHMLHTAYVAEVDAWSAACKAAEGPADMQPVAAAAVAVIDALKEAHDTAEACAVRLGARKGPRDETGPHPRRLWALPDDEETWRLADEYLTLRAIHLTLARCVSEHMKFQMTDDATPDEWQACEERFRYLVWQHTLPSKPRRIPCDALPADEQAKAEARWG